MTRRSLLLKVRLHAKPDDASILIFKGAPFEMASKNQKAGSPVSQGNPAILDLVN